MLPALLLTTTSLLLPAVVHADTLRYGKTPNGFSAPARGWTSSALQSLSGDAKFTLNQENVIEQCDAMREALGAYGYEYCALDAGWSLGDRGDDEHGRITYDPDLFDLPALADHLHGRGAKLGVYILPGYFAADADKTIEGTDDIPLSSIRADDDGDGEPCRAMSRCDIDYGKTGAQEWCNSNVKQFADWGVDLIKLDYVTPGSPDSGADLSSDNSGSVACYHKAIQASGRKMRLHVGWELDMNTTYYDIWRSNADALRTDRALTDPNQTTTTLTQWSSVQRAIERYRQYILPRLDSADELTIHPDLGALPVGNGAALAGLTALQQQAVLTHWIGAGAPLLLGADMTALDASLLADPLANAVAAFTAAHPMVPTAGNADARRGRQRQVWLAGPDPASGVVVAVLANYGAGGAARDLFASDPDDADQVFRLSPKALGLASSGYYAVEDVWAGTTVDLGYDDVWTWTLDRGGAAALLRLTPSMTGDGNDTDATTATATAEAEAQAQQGKRDLEQPQKALFVQYERVLTSATTASGQATAAAASAERTDSASDASSAVVGTTSWGKVSLWVSVAGLQTAMLWLL
ncbi:hypothetical protein SLS58_009742 [Diplodia intermedia]|uniref:Alpha-galactosidase n=1 Tax=Diplodia intermedia TaxID=856260 RepID=A0ABR3TB40_9PEZI